MHTRKIADAIDLATQAGRIPVVRIRRRIGTRVIGLALLALAAANAAHAGIITVGDPSDASCNFHIIQSAINAAAAAPGLDIVRVSIGTYAPQRLTVNDSGELAIEGGFVSCSLPVLAGVSTLSGAGASPTGSVISHYGSGRLTLSDLHITNGLDIYGGGISSSASSALTLKRVLLFNNRATDAGGGLYVAGQTATPTKEVNLLGVGFNGNTALSGGGLFAVNANVLIGGDAVNYFAGNVSQGTQSFHGGGGILALNSHVTIASLPPAQSPFMDGNFAQRKGGAISFLATTPGFYSLYMSNVAGDRPLTIANNAASEKGGAIYMQSGSTSGGNSAFANLYNTIVTDNDALEGAAFYIDSTGTSFSASSALFMEQTEVEVGYPPCPAALRCNRIDFSRGSSTVSVASNSAMGIATFDMRRGHLTDNINLTGSLLGGSGNLRIDNSVVANNAAGSSSNLMFNISHELRISNSTIANNTFGAASVFGVLISPASLLLQNSIVYQPGKAIRELGSGATDNLRNLLVGNGHGLIDLATRNIQQTFDPLFVNAGANDFRLQVGSQGRDRWAPGGGVLLPSIDILGASRPVASPGSPTPYDFGAYEYGAVVDKIFSGRFD